MLGGGRKKACRTAFECWLNVAIKGELSQVLPVPAHFEQAAKMLTEDDVAKEIVCGPDPDAYIADLEEYHRAGFTNVFIHQIGPDQEGFFRFCESELLPRVQKMSGGEKSESSRSELHAG
jgi:hypothetical protein